MLARVEEGCGMARKRLPPARLALKAIAYYNLVKVARKFFIQFIHSERSWISGQRFAVNKRLAFI